MKDDPKPLNRVVMLQEWPASIDPMGADLERQIVEARLSGDRERIEVLRRQLLEMLKLEKR